MEFVNAEYGDQGVLAYSVHPGGVLTELAREGMPEHLHAVLDDTPELGGESICWLGSQRREWASGRYLSVNWDVGELEERKVEIEERDLLRVTVEV